MPKPETNLTVSLEDRQCRSVAGAQLYLTPTDSRTRQRLQRDKAGNFTIRDLSPGRYQIQISKRGYERDSYQIELQPGNNYIPLVAGKRGEPYYFANYKKIYFEPSEHQILIFSEGKKASRALPSILGNRKLTSVNVGSPTAMMGDEACLRCIHLPKRQSRLQREQLLRGIIRDIEKQGLSATAALPVKRGNAPLQGLTNELIVRFHDEVSEKDVATIAKALGLKVRRKVLSSGNAFVLSSNSFPSYDLLKKAEQLVSQHPVDFAEPDLLMQLQHDQYTPNDPLVNLQNHLPLVNCDDAWERMGEWDAERRGGSPDICIAVFDPQGVAPNHSDLTANLTDGTSKLVTAFNFRNMTNQTVAELSGDHGTQCAGTATAAFDNNRGIAGVAPNCHLIGARLPSVLTGQAMADAFLWAAGLNNGNTNPSFPALPTQPADIISNSWGVGNAALSTALQNAFDRLTDEGRGGKGCIVTFSTGNLGYVQFSSIRRFAAYNRTIAVGASINMNPTSPVNSSQADPNGNTNNIAVTTDTRTLYNPFGPEMDVVAPSHTCYAAGSNNLVDPTTSAVRVGTGTLDGCPGSTTCNDYATSFGGTSHASPTVAGTAAMIASAYPLLSWEEIRDVLRRTAVRIDFGNTNAVGQWVDNDGDGIREFSQWYGYGRINVDAAVNESLSLYVAQWNLLQSISGI